MSGRLLASNDSTYSIASKTSSSTSSGFQISKIPALFAYNSFNFAGFGNLTNSSSGSPLSSIKGKPSSLKIGCNSVINHSGSSFWFSYSSMNFSTPFFVFGSPLCSHHLPSCSNILAFNKKEALLVKIPFAGGVLPLFFPLWIG